MQYAHGPLSNLVASAPSHTTLVPCYPSAPAPRCPLTVWQVTAVAAALGPPLLLSHPQAQPCHNANRVHDELRSHSPRLSIPIMATVPCLHLPSPHLHILTIECNEHTCDTPVHSVPSTVSQQPKGHGLASGKGKLAKGRSNNPHYGSRVTATRASCCTTGLGLLRR